MEFNVPNEILDKIKELDEFIEREYPTASIHTTMCGGVPCGKPMKNPITANIIPLMIAGGLMGYLGIKLRPSTAMTFSIALGIAVDNTIHFLARFRQEFKISGDYAKSVSETLLTTGKAIISTGIILSLGFFVLYFSEFVPNHEFGILATIIIIAAVSGSLILLPVLILQIRPALQFNQKTL